jgi:hypothetical protein
MKYETPEMTALTPAINVIQGVKPPNAEYMDSPSPTNESTFGGYADWE